MPRGGGGGGGCAARAAACPLRAPRAVVAWWVCVLCVCAWLGPRFLRETVSSFEAPPGTPAYEATRRLQAAFPLKSRELSLFALVERRGDGGGGVVTPEVRAFSERVAREAAGLPRVRGVEGFFALNASGLPGVAASFVGPDGRSTLLAVRYLSPNRTDSALVRDLRRVVADAARAELPPARYRAGVTGLDALFVDVISQSERDMVRIDAVVLPLALLVLAWYVRSARLLLVPVLALATSASLSFTLMLPAAVYLWDVATFTPSIMLTVSLAMTIDYQLFMLTRFGEEIRNGARPRDAVATTVRRAGHVVLVSGTTLTLTFLALALFPLDFLRTVGIGAATALVCTMLVSLTLTPALILCFPGFFSNFSPPCSGLVARLCDRGGGGGGGGARGGASVHASPSPWDPRRGGGRRARSPSSSLSRGDHSRLKSVQDEDPRAQRLLDVSHLDDGGSDGGGGGGGGSSVAASGRGGAGSSAPGSVLGRADLLSAHDYDDHDELMYGGGRGGASEEVARGCWCCCGCLRRCRRRLSAREEQYADTLSPRSRKQLVRQLDSCWHRSGKYTTRTWVALGVVAAVLAVTVPVSLQVLHLRTTVDSTQLFPRNSDALRTYRDLSDDFPAGVLFPFKVLCEPREGGIFTERFFNRSTLLARRLVREGLARPRDVASLSYVNGTEVPLSLAQQLLAPLNASAPPLPPVLAELRGSYRFLFAQLANTANTSALMTVETEFDPLNEESESWIRRVRGVLAGSDGAVSFRLTGGSTSALDAVDEIYRLFPRMIGVTVGLVFVAVAVMFRSLLIPARLLVTTTLPITWVYGLAVLVFQRGWLNWLFPSLRDTKALYWLTPIMSFSILVGLALDYDVFLLSRAAEYRRAGYTDRACIVKAVYRTGAIITGAGVIMAVSFGGLCLSQEMILVQFGFILSLAVLLDTFVVRTALVPAILHLGSGRMMWWPGRMPLGFRDALDQSDVARRRAPREASWFSASSKSASGSGTGSGGGGGVSGGAGGTRAGGVGADGAGRAVVGGGVALDGGAGAGAGGGGGRARAMSRGTGAAPRGRGRASSRAALTRAADVDGGAAGEPMSDSGCETDQSEPRRPRGRGALGVPPVRAFGGGSAGSEDFVYASMDHGRSSSPLPYDVHSDSD